MEGMKKLVKNTSLFALVLAILIAVLPPFFYFFLRHQYHFAVLETEAEIDGLLVTEIINASPEYWRYQHDKLEEIISTGTIKMPHETRSILDSGGVVIARSGNEIKRPIMTRSHNLYDSGNVVGRIEISRSLWPVLIDTLAVGLFSFFIGLSVFATLKIFPLRALSQTLQSLQIEKGRAEENAEEVRKLNEELELKIEERTKQLLEAREELIRKEKLAVLGQLAGSVGHELRNPLGVMSNAIYFLKTVLSESDETVREYLNMIKTVIDNSERIISDLLDFSRTKTPQLQSIGTSELLSTSLGKCAA